MSDLPVPNALDHPSVMRLPRGLGGGTSSRRALGGSCFVLAIGLALMSVMEWNLGGSVLGGGLAGSHCGWLAGRLRVEMEARVFCPRPAALHPVLCRACKTEALVQTKSCIVSQKRRAGIFSIWSGKGLREIRGERRGSSASSHDVQGSSSWLCRAASERLPVAVPRVR